MRKIILLVFLITGCGSSKNFVPLENNELHAINTDFLKNEVTKNIRIHK
jgi:hypothetical protein